MTGSLQTKKLASGKEYYYIVLNFYTPDGKRRPKWVSTGLPVKGNKRKAEAMLNAELQKYPTEIYVADRDMLFSDAIKKWLSSVEASVTKSTYEGYSLHCQNPIQYFAQKKLTLGQLTARHFEEFYNEMLTRGKVNRQTGERSGLAVRTVRSYKFIINATLNQAVAHEVIPKNPALNVKVTNKTKKQLARKIQFFTTAEANRFLEFVYRRNDILADLLFATLYFGLRRSEVLGLRTFSVDFENHRLYIDHTVVKVSTIQKKDDTKTPDSERIYPLSGEMEAFFHKVIDKKEACRRFYGNTYYKSDYLFTWEDGHLFRPDYIYHHFKDLVSQFGRPTFTFHNLRHSTASILYEKGWGPKDIQEWLGHADFYTTMNIYTHLEKAHRADKAKSLDGVFSITG